MQLNPKMKTSAALLIGPLAASMLLAGCGGDSKPPASGSSTTASSPTSTASTSTPVSPTATASRATDPNIPAAARAHTPAGAEAFVRYFYTQLNIAWSKPQAGLISSLSEASCKTCSALEGSAMDLATKQQRYRGKVFAVRTIDATGKTDVLVVGEQPGGAVVDSKGSVVKKRTTAQQAKFIVSLAWSSNSWRIREMKVMQ